LVDWIVVQAQSEPNLWNLFSLLAQLRCAELPGVLAENFLPKSKKVNMHLQFIQSFAIERSSDFNWGDLLLQFILIFSGFLPWRQLINEPSKT
jgi:hypothetical protein